MIPSEAFFVDAIFSAVILSERFHFYGTCRVKRTKKNVGVPRATAAPPTCLPACLPVNRCVVFNFAANVSFAISLFSPIYRPFVSPLRGNKGQWTLDTRYNTQPTTTLYKIACVQPPRVYLPCREEVGRKKQKPFLRVFGGIREILSPPQFENGTERNYISIIIREKRTGYGRDIYTRHLDAHFETFERGSGVTRGRRRNLIRYPPLLIR